MVLSLAVESFFLSNAAYSRPEIILPSMALRKIVFGLKSKPSI